MSPTPPAAAGLFQGLPIWPHLFSFQHIFSSLLAPAILGLYPRQTGPANCCFWNLLTAITPSLPPALLTQCRFHGPSLCYSLHVTSVVSTHSPFIVLSWQNPKPCPNQYSPYSMPAPEQLSKTEENSHADWTHFSRHHKPHAGPQCCLVV